jgi:glycosyltransferase involved in cell wall biosynthesis
MTDVKRLDTRVTVAGKFFRCGREKFHAKGITYGPFAPDAQGETFGTRDQARRDFEQILELGANTLRVYYLPPVWFLGLAAEHGLRVFVDVPWPKHLCFLERKELAAEARQAVRNAVSACHRHPAILAFSVVNEVPADIARWGGSKRTERFIEELVEEAKGIDPDCLCTFASYPPTEFLNPQNIDFVCFNVYLHHRPSFEAYLARLQTLADMRPLVLGEFGMDSWREGEAAKCDFLAWQIESAFRNGLAGTVLFSFTDDWFRGGHQIEDWSFGLTDRHRAPKKSFHVVQQAYRVAPQFPLPRAPRVSVVVASYNGGRTLKSCLDSLSSLNYPDYEVILVDDGSTDETPLLAQQFPNVRTLRQPNLGLSAARNAGVAAATGEIIAFTDSDCRADEDWLYYLVSDLISGDFVGMGGPNFLPPEDSAVATAVMASPGGPAHVMLTDREAEHIPGCNMAFYKWALEAAGGFDPVFRKAGDDVDVCWRLQTSGHKLGFSPSGFVWHYRRSSVKAYLKQQAGYGEAEALLARKHPDFFGPLGGSIWRGRIYASGKAGLITRRAVIYHGLFGSGFFQKLYTPMPASATLLATSLWWHLWITLPAFLVSVYLPAFLPLALAAIGTSAAVSVAYAVQADIARGKRRWWIRPLVAWLFFLQPIVRGWARYRATWLDRTVTSPLRAPPDRSSAGVNLSETLVSFWNDKKGLDRCQFLNVLFARLQELRLQARLGSGWTEHDLEFTCSSWARLLLCTVTEELAEGRSLLHCRLRGVWTLRARLLFGLCLGGTLLVTELFRPWTEWIWMTPLILPLLYLFFENEVDRARRLLAHFIVECALGKKLVPLKGSDLSKHPARTQHAAD